MSKHLYPGFPSDFFKLMLTLFLFACQKQVIQKNASDEYARQVTNSATLKPGAFDKYNYEVNLVNTLSGTTFGGFADGASNMAQFNSPLGLAQDAAGNIYIADEFNNRIRKMAPDGTVSTVAGIGFGGYKDGPGATAQFEYPTGVAVDSRGYIYVADQGNNRIRVITPDGVVSTVAGTGAAGFSDGPGASARFKAPTGIAVDPAGVVYVADRGNNRIRRISTAGVVTQWVGDGIAGFKDAAGAYAELNGPTGLAIGPKGEVYVADAGNNRLRKIVSGVISTVAQINTPYNVALDGAGNILVTDIVDGAVYAVTPAGVVRTLFGKGVRGIADGEDAVGRMYSPAGIVVNAVGDVIITDDGLIRRLTAGRGVGTFLGSIFGDQDGVGTNALIRQPYDVVFDSAGNMFISDFENKNIRKVTPAGVSTVLAGHQALAGSGNGDGTGTAANLGWPIGMTIDPSGNLYMCDFAHRSIRKITPAGVVTTIAGGNNIGHRDGPALSAGLEYVDYITRDRVGNLYFTDGSYVRKLDLNGYVTTVVRIPNYNSTTNRYLWGITYCDDGNLYVVSDHYLPGAQGVGSEIWKVPTSGLAGIFANLPPGYDPQCITYDAGAHNFYITVVVNNYNGQAHYEVCKIDALGQLSDIAGGGDVWYIYADGEASYARFGFMKGIAIGPNGRIYVGDCGNALIRMIGK